MAQHDDIHAILHTIVEEYAPDIAGRVATAMVDQTEADSVERTMAEMIAVWVEERGVQEAYTMADQLADYMAGGAPPPDEAGSAAHMSLLVETYQALEAKRRAQARAWARRTAVILRRFGPLVGRALTKAYKP